MAEYAEAAKPPDLDDATIRAAEARMLAPHTVRRGSIRTG